MTDTVRQITKGAKPQIVRPRDLLRATAQPIHPFDEAHGVDTSGLVPAADLLTGHPNDTHVTAYYAVAPSILRAMIARWRETPPSEPIHRYTFVDMGAGKGRAMLVASELPFQAVLGVELNPTLAAVARVNLAIWRAAHAADPTASPIAPVELLEADALAIDLPTTPTLLFLFHPFEAPVLKALLRRIETQFATRAGELDLLYVNAECADVFDRHPAFTLLWSGKLAMSPDDHLADLAAIAQQAEYGSTGDEICAIYRYTGRSLRK